MSAKALKTEEKPDNFVIMVVFFKHEPYINLWVRPADVNFIINKNDKLWLLNIFPH